jgi:predicted phage tail protein
MLIYMKSEVRETTHHILALYDIWVFYVRIVNTKSSSRQWKRQASLVDSRDAVQYLQFAPRHHGLRLVPCCLRDHTILVNHRMT